jgi:hypothetical protein
MTKTNQSNPALDRLPEAHRRLVQSLSKDNRAPKPGAGPLQQWLIWMGFALLAVVLTLSLIGPQFELAEKLADLASGGFLLLAFALSSLAAWMGIRSSLPDHQPQLWPRVLVGGLVLFLFSMPFLYFGKDSLAQVWALNAADGWFCARTVVLVAFPSWVVLGWMASRNASFRPGWTGAWLGVSAFLLGSGTIQLHCSHWETCHMLVDHLLPMLVLIFLPIWAGSYWFSRWNK